MINNHVLIIEDDKIIAEYFQAVLTLAGMQVEIVLSAREGLIRLSGAAPGLILLDMRLGTEISGEDILLQIRSNPRFNATHVIVVTGYPNTAQMVYDLADLVLIKPVGIDQLTTLAQRMLSFEIAPKFYSFRDLTSGLYTPEFFRTRLELAFERGKRRPDFVYAVIVYQLEVRRLSGETVNANAEGSLSILVEVAGLLKQNLRPTDTIARMTEWKFVTLNEDLRQGDDVAIIIERIQKVFATPVQVGAEQIQVEMLYGTAVRQAGFCDAAELLSAAEHSLELARAEKPVEPGGPRKTIG